MTDTAKMMLALRGKSPDEQRNMMSALVTDMTFREVLQTTYDPFLQVPRARSSVGQDFDADAADAALDREWGYFRDAYQMVIDGQGQFDILYPYLTTAHPNPAAPVYAAVVNKTFPGLAANTARSVWGDIPALRVPDYGPRSDRVKFPVYLEEQIITSTEALVMVRRGCPQTATVVGWDGERCTIGGEWDAVQYAATTIAYRDWFSDRAGLSEFAILVVAIGASNRLVYVRDVIDGEKFAAGLPTHSYRVRRPTVVSVLNHAPVKIETFLGPTRFLPSVVHHAEDQATFDAIVQRVQGTYVKRLIAHAPGSAYGEGCVVWEAK